MEIIMTIDFPDAPSWATMRHGPEPLRARDARSGQAGAPAGGGRPVRARLPAGEVDSAPAPARARRPGANPPREVASRGPSSRGRRRPPRTAGGLTDDARGSGTPARARADRSGRAPRLRGRRRRVPGRLEARPLARRHGHAAPALALEAANSLDRFTEDDGMNDDVRRVMKVADRPSVVMVEGQGSWLWDREGKQYLDFVQGWAVNCLGHSPRVIREALNSQAQRLINCSPAYYNE